MSAHESRDRVLCGALLAILAGGKDLIVNFPQQPNWTGSLSEMERISSASSSSYWYVSYPFSVSFLCCLLLHPVHETLAFDRLKNVYMKVYSLYVICN